MHLLAMMGGTVSVISAASRRCAGSPRRPTSSADRCWRCTPELYTLPKNWCGRISNSGVVAGVQPKIAVATVVRPCLSLGDREGRVCGLLYQDWQPTSSSVSVGEEGA